MTKKPMTLRVGDREYTIANWAKIKGKKRSTFYARHKDGWPPAQVIGEEPRPKYQLLPHQIPKPRKGPKPRKNTLTEPVEITLLTKSVIMTDSKATGAAAGEVRRRAGLSMQQASESLGLALSQVHDLEHGHTKWTQRHIDHFNEVAKGWVKQ